MMNEIDDIALKYLHTELSEQIEKSEIDFCLWIGDEENDPSIHYAKKIFQLYVGSSDYKTRFNCILAYCILLHSLSSVRNKTNLINTAIRVLKS